MNIMTANRLLELRKENNLSQEALAEKLGISRQAVSKWERAEASPDTDNLIALAKLYGISLDELLGTEQNHNEKPTVYAEAEKSEGQKGFYHSHENFKQERRFHHQEERKAIYGFPFVLLVVAVYIVMGVFWGAWHPAWILFLLIPLWYTVIEAFHKKNANIFAYPVVVVIVFLLLGFYKGAWYPAWILFLTIPIYYGIVNFIGAIRKD